MKRLLAYSAIVNIGYILLAFIVSSSFNLFSAMYYLIVYIFISFNLFILLFYIRRYPLKSKLKNLVEFVSITHSNIYLSGCLMISLFSMAGIPPFAGFFSKLVVFCSFIAGGNYLLALCAVLLSVLICVYYIS